MICTDGRLTPLKTVLQALSALDDAAFELVLVCGPTPDGTRAFAEALAGVKVAHCPARNLSQARNIGVAQAAGEIVAFLDDDAIPEPGWLADLALAYDDAEVAAAGGIVYDASGLSLQARYVTVDRLGYAHGHWSGPAERLNFPYSPQFPHLLGANASFRRSVLTDLGGFDEEYDYFLDETDLLARVNDSGGRIAQLAGAAVHHRPAPSALRGQDGAARQWRPLIKNRLYFILRNGAWRHHAAEALRAAADDAEGWRRTLTLEIARGERPPADLDRLEQETREGVAAALAAAGRPRRLMTPAQRRSPPPWIAFPLPPRPARRLTIALVSQDYPPGANGGVARNTQEMARAFARLGHKAHVFTRAREAPSLDFEDGVWVHRAAVPVAGPPPDLTGRPIPQAAWDFSRAMFDEVARRKADLVYAPLWDAEAVAFVAEPRFALLCALQTPLEVWLDSHPDRRDDEAMRGRLALERWLLERSPYFHANSRALTDDIARRYGLHLPPSRLVFAPHGLADWAGGVAAPSGGLRFLFVGRLESRKGIAALLAAAPAVLRAWPEARLDLVGDDCIAGPRGSTFREVFLARGDVADISDRVVFHGRVDEDALRAHYAACDIFVAPSLYESFGLVFVEAMMFGKPVIAARVGGAVEVVSDGETGLLVAPGDAAALAAAMDRLARDPNLRRAMGAAGRRRYEARFGADAAAARLIEGWIGRSLDGPGLTPPFSPSGAKAST